MFIYLTRDEVRATPTYRIHFSEPALCIDGNWRTADPKDSLMPSGTTIENALELSLEPGGGPIVFMLTSVDADAPPTL